MKKLILALVSTAFLLSSCAEKEILYVETAFPYIPPHKVEKQTFKPLRIDYEITN